MRVNRMVAVAAEIRASHQYHRRSLQKASQLCYMFMVTAIFYIGVTIAEKCDMNPWFVGYHTYHTIPYHTIA
jgi:hypothetical protein